MESDRGGFAPRGFTIDGNDTEVEYLAEWKPLFAPYNIHIIEPGYGGVDINPLKEFGTPLIGFVPDSQRYFDVHHTANDVFEHVNRRELELGAATMASMIYLIDKYGMPERVEP
jgi:acetylornithine deacetylase/succinyl-diaminopimelate desuccinylase-like protein